MGVPCVGVIHDERLVREIRYREQHEDQCDGNHARLEQRVEANMVTLAALLPAESRTRWLAAVFDEQYADDYAAGETHGDQKGVAVADCFRRADAQIGADRLREGVHRAVEPHPRAHARDGQQHGEPCGQAYRDAGESDAVEYARGQQPCGVRHEVIPQIRRQEYERADHRELAFARAVGKIAGNRSADERAERECAGEEAHECAACTERLREAGDDWRAHHAACHIEERGRHDECHIAGDEPLPGFAGRALAGARGVAAGIGLPLRAVGGTVGGAACLAVCVVAGCHDHLCFGFSLVVAWVPRCAARARRTAPITSL